MFRKGFYYNCVFALCVMVSFFTSVNVVAQGESSNWLFGRKAGINFNEGAVTPIENGAIDTNEGCASISNSAGELLFYTDGILVWDKNHNVMPNGSNLFGNKSSTQSAVVVPKPNSDSIYYIFTVIHLGNIEGVKYSEVDMTLNGGNGDVTSNKNITLTGRSAEKISAVQHANGTDFWIATHTWNSDEFSVFEITENGVNTTPVNTNIGSFHGGTSFNSIGYMKFSPNGKRLAVAKWSTDSTLEIFDFDSSTGVISNPVILDDFFGKDYRNGVYGIEFSPNSNMLYATDLDLAQFQSVLYQFDLRMYDASSIISSSEIIYQGREVLAALQLTSTGEIYACNGFSRYLNAIQKPNIKGIGCDYRRRSVYLGSGSAVFGLPTFIQSLFVANIDASDACLIDAVEFSIETDEPIDSISWDFGDSQGSNEVSPSHNYLAAGEYTVNAKIQSGNRIINVTKEVTVFQSPIAYQVDDYTICEDEENDGFETFELIEKNAEVLGDQSELDFEVSYFDTLADAEAHENALGTQTTNKENYQEIFVKVSNRLNDACYSISSFLLIVETAIAGEVEDYTLCIDRLDDGGMLVDLNQFNDAVYDPTSVSPHADYQVTYYLSQLAADTGLNPLEPDIFVVTSNSTTIFARLENLEAGCFTTSNFDIIINEALAFKPQDMYLCDDASNDGKARFDLGSQRATILNGGVGSVTFHVSQSDADSGENPLSDSFENQTSIQEIFVRVAHTENANCYDTTSFFIELTPQSVINISKTWYICPDEDVVLYADSIHETYLWSTGESASEIIVNSPGTYSLTVYDNLTDELKCGVTETIQVLETVLPTSIDITTEEWTSFNNTIQIGVNGTENNMFSIDDDVYQSSNIFNNLEAGEYIVYVKNENDCLVYSEEVYILNYPKFFTPNNDGYNDYWKIDLLEKEPETEIHIFDRYGKLITRLNAFSQGWDGTLNGELLATSDYWFVVNRPSKNKQYKGHFTLKR